MAPENMLLGPFGKQTPPGGQRQAEPEKGLTNKPIGLK